MNVSGTKDGGKKTSSGIQLKRNKVSKYFELTVNDGVDVWKLYLKELPVGWFHFTFTWRKNDGLRIFINGQEKVNLHFVMLYL